MPGQGIFIAGQVVPFQFCGIGMCISCQCGLWCIVQLPLLTETTRLLWLDVLEADGQFLWRLLLVKELACLCSYFPKAVGMQWLVCCRDRKVLLLFQAVLLFKFPLRAIEAFITIKSKMPSIQSCFIFSPLVFDWSLLSEIESNLTDLPF